MKSISIAFSAPSITIPINYHHEVQSIIYRLLRGIKSEDVQLHSEGEGLRQYKLFTFSSLRGRNTIKNKRITYGFDKLATELYHKHKGKRNLRLTISQLKETPKNKIKKGALTMITKQSNNMIPNIHQIVTIQHGENYWFNGCAKYVMECLGEKDYDYLFFAGLTGDNFAQIYAYNKGFRGDSATEYRMDEPSLIENVFEKCGFASTFVREKQLRDNKEMYLQTLIAYIDKDIPVIRYQWTYGVFVGYEDYGKTLLYLTSDKKEPERISLDDALPVEVKDREWQDTVCGWIFVGEKKEQKDLKQIYRNVIDELPKLLTAKTDKYCFGAEAFRTWAEDMENGRFDDMKPEEFSEWMERWMKYVCYICNLATNSGGAQNFMKKALELNPDMTFLTDVCHQYRITGLLWNGNYDACDIFAAEYAKSN
ncbi:MAG: hypothetical protein LBI03_04795, partial [Clostridiales bacterium]|nr:hypothetical protein [Clostridiales bacterium]